jgi:hypothetical protein
MERRAKQQIASKGVVDWQKLKNKKEYRWGVE